MMKKIFIIIFTLFCFSLVYGNELLPENPMDGAKLFIAKNCVKCHSIRSKGGKVGPDLGRIRIEETAFDIAARMWNHASYMVLMANESSILWPRFSEKEILNIIGYLYYLDYFDEPGDSDMGRKLFNEKGCVKCHAVEGTGGKVGPSLDAFSKEVSPIFMAQAMWNHGPEMDNVMKSMGIKRPIFIENEMRDLLAYIKKEKGKEIFISPGNAKEGKRLFSEKGCMKCHPIKGKGGMVAPDLGKKAKELKQSMNRIAGMLWNFSPNMSSKMKEMGLSYPKFSGREMADIIAYIYFLGYFEETADISEGKKLFSEKGCIKCHPKLKNFSSSMEGFANMWNNVPLMKASMEGKGIVWPILKEGEMGSLLEYMRGGIK